MMQSIFINVAHAGVISEAPRLSQLGLGIVYFLLSAFFILAIIGLVVSGLLFFFARGNEKQVQVAKRASRACIVGIILGLSAMIIIRFIQMVI